MPRFVSIFFDVEDPFGEFADDAALEVAGVFEASGLRATFPVTGEKCRKLVERGRTDVIRALQPHALGLHTNTHSVHPTTMELLEDKGWEDGCSAAVASEGPGLEAFMTAFGRRPCCWAGAGYTWGPQITGVLDDLGIPSYVYALTSVGRSRPHQYLGKLGFPGFLGAKEPEYEDADTTDQAIKRVLAGLDSVDAPWASVFCGHPTKMRYWDYWDRSYYSGVNPDPYVPVEAKPRPAFDQSLRNLERFLRAIGRHHTVLGLDDVVRLPWTFSDLSASERAVAIDETVDNIRWRAGDWPVHKPLLRTDRIEAETLAHFDTLRVANLS